jgi:hypothetical protein
MITSTKALDAAFHYHFHQDLLEVLAGQGELEPEFRAAGF